MPQLLARTALLALTSSCFVACVAPPTTPETTPATTPPTTPPTTPATTPESPTTKETAEPPSCTASLSSLPATLSAAGLFADIANDLPCAGVRPFTPAATLWSDGAEKRRFLRLPDGGVIDASDIDHWSFPPGTRLWKEFVVDGVRTETRMMLKTGAGDGEDAWTFAAYAWRADGNDADRVDDGVAAAHEGGWAIPSSTDCKECHVDTAGRFHVLGFSAVLLSADDQLQRLVDASLLAPAPPTTRAPAHAWPAAQRDALLYLSVNCGHCHQRGGQGYEATVDDSGVGLDLHVAWADLDAGHTGAATTTSAPLLTPVAGLTDRVVAGHPESSGLYERLRHRGEIQMPPLGTDIVDDDGAAKVAAWISAL